MIDWIDITEQETLKWSEVLKVLADGIRLVAKPDATGARIYPHWIYEIDAQSLLGKVTASMRATSGTSAGTIRAWTLGINAANVVKGANNVPDVVGSSQWDWRLSIDVWGLFENDGTAAAIDRAYEESKRVSGILWRNRDNIISATKYLTELTLLEFNINSTPFSDGSNVIVAAGAMQAKVKEAYTI